MANATAIRISQRHGVVLYSLYDSLAAVDVKTASLSILGNSDSFRALGSPLSLIEGCIGLDSYLLSSSSVNTLYYDVISIIFSSFILK